MKFTGSMAKFAKLLVVTLASTSAFATTTPEVAQAASAAVAKEAGKVVPGKVLPKGTPATSGSITGKGDENQFPAGTIPIPPKPKKEVKDAAAGVSIKGGENQFPAGTIPIPPKPKKEGLEAAGAAAAKAKNVAP